MFLTTLLTSWRDSTESVSGDKTDSPALLFTYLTSAGATSARFGYSQLRLVHTSAVVFVDGRRRCLFVGGKREKKIGIGLPSWENILAAF